MTQHESRPPAQLDGADVLEFTRPAGKSLGKEGVPQHPSVVALALCRYADDPSEGYYVFGCDEDWNVICDSLDRSVEAAKRTAEDWFIGGPFHWIVRPAAPMTNER